MMSKRPTKSDQRKPRQPQRRNAAQAATTMPLASAAAGATLHRIAGALEQIALSLPGGAANGDVDQSFAAADAFVWNPVGRMLPVTRVSRVEIGLLKGIDRMRDTLIEN